MATFLAHREFFDYYSYLLTDQFLVYNYLWQFHAIRPAIPHGREFFRRPRMPFGK